MDDKNKSMPKLPIDEFTKLPTNEIPSDVLGSYLGTSADGGAPEQDADDL